MNVPLREFPRTRLPRKGYLLHFLLAVFFAAAFFAGALVATGVASASMVFAAFGAFTATAGALKVSPRR